MKQFIFQIDTRSPKGFCIIERETQAQAVQAIQAIGHVYPYVYEAGREVVEEYKGFYITTQKMNKTDTAPTIEVFNPNKNTFFIVCMDDSKTSGNRTFDESLNTVLEARNYIDWVLQKDDELQAKRLQKEATANN